MRRRRRSQGTWFPTIGSEISEGVNAAGRAFTLNLGALSQTPLQIVTPLTFDEPTDLDNFITSEKSLTDIIGSEYVLKRIVGKMFINRISQLDINGNDPNPALLCGAGLFVARAGDDVTTGAQERPIGFAVLASDAQTRENYSPLDNDTMREPWIWRRNWVLGTAGQNLGITGVANSHSSSVGAVTGDSASCYPASTALFGSVADGPHVDSRVRRRVRQDQRLWLAVALTSFPIAAQTDATAIVGIRGYFDYRMFGSLRKARNQSAF